MSSGGLVTVLIGHKGANRASGTGSGVAAVQARLLPRFTRVDLVIGNTPGNLKAKTAMYVTVSVPSLDAITLQGDGNITATGINSRSVSVALPGSGVIHAVGATARLDVSISGDGTALLGQLIAQDANAGVEGDGSITLTATHSLDASISGSGTILYGGGPPLVTTKLTGNGTITPG
jgi:Putative auto-transporter adhesin, head GIN domain